MRKIFNYLILLLFITTSCSDEYSSSGSDPDFQSASQLVKSAGDGKYDLLGYGYDITGEYLSPSSSRPKVIDIDRLIENEKLNGKQAIDSTNTKSEWDDFYYGSDALDYIKEVNRKVASKNGANNTSPLGALGGKLLGFSATLNVDTETNSKTTHISKNSYARSETTIELKRLFINRKPNELYKYLSNDFKKHLQTYTPKQLVETYGTHVLTNIQLGGRLYSEFTSIYNEDNSYSNKITHVKAGLNVSLKMVGMNTDNDVSHTSIETINKKNSAQHMHIRAIGGSRGINVTYDFKENTTPPQINKTEWVNSVYANNGIGAALVGIDWDRAYFIYEFIEDAEKREAVKQAVITYIQSKQIKMINVVPLYQYSKNWSFYYDTKLNPPYLGDKTLDGITCYVEVDGNDGAIPLYQYSKNWNFYYDTKLNPPYLGDKTLDGITCYVRTDSNNGRVPLYQYSKNWSFYYDTKLNPPYLGDKTLDGITCYVYH